MISDSNTVINPWAMMVESFNTQVANGTMS